MRTNFSSAGLLLAGLILAAAASAADPVYKWTDRAGHTHYSQTPPQGQKYQTIVPVSPAPATPAPAADAATDSKATPKASEPTPAQVARQKLCETARNNVQVLANQPLVEMDIGGTGKSQRLTPAQQTEQLDKARQQVGTYCGGN
jgi:hypothetical protein